jgi:hypothetical protein
MLVETAASSDNAKESHAAPVAVSPIATAALRARHPLSSRERLLAEALVILYIAGVAALALRTHTPYLLFPELAALVYDILLRPWGKWASQPLRLVITPSITALIGTLVTRHLPFNGLTVSLVVIASAGVILALRSVIIPAMSAGLLPLVLSLTSWLYPVCMFLTLAVLALICVAWKRYQRRAASSNPPPRDVEDILESSPHGYGWFILLVAFAAVLAEAARLTGLRLIIFPPLVTMAFEMFGHHGTTAWARRPLSLPFCCLVVSLGSLLAFRLFGNGVLVAVASVVIGVIALRSFRLHMPPAMAIGLLVAVIAAPDYKFPVAVFLGTSALTAVSFVHQRIGR